MEAWVFPLFKEYRGVITTASRVCGEPLGVALLDTYAFTGDAQGCIYSQTTPSLVPTDAPRIGEWSHVVSVRSGTTLYYFVNGVLIDSVTSSIDATSSNLVIGQLSWNQASYHYSGYLDEVRFTKRARYTSNFTPPTDRFSNY